MRVKSVHCEDWGINYVFKNRKRISLQTYWMTRYLLVLLIGLAIVALISAIWIRHTNVSYRMDTMEVLAEQITNQLTDVENPTNDVPNRFIGDPEKFSRQDIKPKVYITNTDGDVLNERAMGPKITKIPKEVLTSSDEKQTLKDLDGISQTYYMVKKKVEIDEKHVGWVVVMEDEKMMTRSNQAYGQLALMIGALALIGLGAIYYLTSRLVRPIREVAVAAKQIQEGNYAISLPDHPKEREVYELVTSFTEMANRLEQLEAMRTELLAGVTHELKTPVTAIDGLLQALKDGVVTGEEAREFVQMAMVETKKMKTMVGDLLAFNSFAVNAIPLKFETKEINSYVENTMKQWQTTQEFEEVQITLDEHVEPIHLSIDPIRFQQICTNLWTNAAQAMHEQGQIHIRLQADKEKVRIFVQDEGSGIPKEEQPFIFDRFYRGENKKYAIRGLGLGLPLSKMMAQSMQGDLRLVHSDEQGTCFVIELKRNEA